MPMRVLAAVGCLLMMTPGLVGAADGGLPREWHGDWVGQLTVYAPTGKVFQRPWDVHIEPLPQGEGVTWRITSSMGGKTSVRNYELLPDAKRTGEFKIDEKNGILLDARLLGQTLYSYYKDGDILISSRFERRGDSLIVELASVETKDPRISTVKEAGIEIQSYRLGSVQVGELKRKSSSR